VDPLRHVTRYHRAQVEQHFRVFWIPTLALTYSEFIPGGYFTASEQSPNNQGGGRDVDTARFASQFRKDAYEWEDWKDWDSETEIPSAVFTLGEGFLNKGYTKGGIMNHIPIIPSYSSDSIGRANEICLHWKPLFTQLLCEEMLMRKFRDRLLDAFLPVLDDSVSEGSLRNDALWKFLSHHFQNQRWEMVDAYRERALDSCFDTPFLSLPSQTKTSSALQNVFQVEGGMVFQIPGWHTFDIREVARLRINEELITEDMARNISMGDAGEQYLEEMKGREAQMLGKEEASDETLEELLRGEALDGGGFRIGR
jgi:hypothetical protein